MRSPRTGANVLATACCLLALPAAATAPFVSEIHYDDEGQDEGEAIEVSGPAGLDLGGFALVLYNGATGDPYSTLTLSGTLPPERDGHGAVAVTLGPNGLQNGPDGVALVDPGGAVLELLGWEGAFTARSGPAAGRVASDIGVSEDGGTPAGTSLQRGGPSTLPEDLVWLPSAPATFGSLNPAQSFDGTWPEAEIPEVQGMGHTSPLQGTGVRVRGVVTATERFGFYLQSPGDGDPDTSDAVFAYTGMADALPALAPGDEVVVLATVTEYTPGGAASANLSTTELTIVRVAEHTPGAAMPPATCVGRGGREPPTQVADDDGLSLFEPATDGLDFWESLEGMRVLLPAARAVSVTNVYRETFVVVDEGAGATGRSARGVLAESSDDANPERVRVRHDADLTPGPSPSARVGDDFGDVTGVLDYAFGSFEVRATTALEVEVNPLEPETTPLGPLPGHLRIASYNVKNLHPGEPPERFDALARHLVLSLRSPEVVALEEIQDDDGPADTGEVRAGATARLLVEATQRVGGATAPAYVYVDLPPEDGRDGGQPGANIRTGFLYDTDRLSLVPGATRRLVDDDPTDGDAFENSRKPLVVELDCAGHRVVLVGLHLTSRSGSTPAFGAVQPPEVGGAAKRLAQARVVARATQDVRAALPDALVVVLGDLNDTFSSEPLGALADAGLQSLGGKLAPEERYSFVYDGGGVLLDHVLVAQDRYAQADFDVVHVNTELRDPASDHDPVLARVPLVPAPEPATTGGAALVTLGLLRALLRGRSGRPPSRAVGGCGTPRRRRSTAGSGP